MKSALEIALERTKNIVAQEDPNALPKEALDEIRSVNQDFDASIAEVEVLMSSKARDLQGQVPREELQTYLQQLAEGFRQKKDEINAERNVKIEEITAKYKKKD
jgi:hypothetical protein